VSGMKRGMVTEEQEMFGEAVRRFAANEYGTGPAPHRLAFDRARFRRLGELGCLSLGVPEHLGGLGGPVEAMVALAALGPALPLEPVVESGIHAASLIAIAAPEAQAGKLLAPIVAGERVAVLADLETEGRYDRGPRTTIATSSATGWRIDGAKPLVGFGAEADLVLVSALAPDGPALFLVEAGTPGLSRLPVRRVDGVPAADIRLDGVEVGPGDRLAPADPVAALLRAADLAAAAAIAEMSGIMDALTRTTIDYARARRQFGQPIGSFQALQHRIADMWMACEDVRSVAAAAARACAAGEALATISQAMVVAIPAARRVSNEAIQIHGGIGMSDELIVGHWHRRILALGQAWGDRAFHVNRLTGA
jgi:alkylation response protein AidB-like acyl-CoA dehydrogenase